MGFDLFLCFPLCFQIVSMLLDRSVKPDSLNRNRQVRVLLLMSLIESWNVYNYGV